MRKKLIIQGIFWVLVYLLLVSAPLWVLLIGEMPAGREFWRELSVSLGFAGLAMMSLQFVLTARFKTIKAPYGADIIYHFHRQISLVALILILFHPLLLFIFSPSYLALLNLLTAPWRARAGVTAVVLLAMKMITKFIGVWPLSRVFYMRSREANYTALLMSTGLTFGTISALFGLQNKIISQEQYSVLVTVVILSAFVPTLIAQKFFQPTLRTMNAWGRLYQRKVNTKPVTPPQPTGK